MRGIPGSVTRGLPRGARMEVIDNTGAKEVEIVMVPKIGGVLKRYPAAGVGDLIVVSVKKGTPEMRRQVLYAVIVRQKRPFKRPDGSTVRFEDNACVIINEEDGEVKGSQIKGPVAREAAQRWPRIAATATTIV
ncbi:MAG TPA: 50S ribosomal protein L14 [Candidatus Thermoplasmatota archaeon]|nr:50S ribosomal protein L14 [Candidatus Thermoplasmatota archaeon]